MRNLALLRRLNTTVRTGLLAGAVAITSPLPAQTPTDLKTVMSRAADGDVESQHALGNAYANGTTGVTQDYAEALKWYRRAADKGYAPAQFSYGLACELGRGMPADARLAFKYYLLAAEQSFAPAQFSVGNMYASGRGVGQDFFEANLWFRQAADAGVVEAQFNMGFAYEAGNGVKKDESQAARWYRLAAERGYPRAQYNLGLLLEDGRGVPKDPAAASTLYRTAAEQGFAPAQVNYALMLSEGRAGAPADPVQAYVWLSRAAKTGVGTEARDALARTLTDGQLAAAKSILGGQAEGTRGPASPVNGNADGNFSDQPREQDRRLAVPPTGKPGIAENGNVAAEAGTPAFVIANLQRDNARLNDEVKRATRELLSLNSQLRTLRSQPAKPAVADANAGQESKLSAQLGQLQDQTARMEVENRKLLDRIAELEKESKAATSETQSAAQLRQQLEVLRKEKGEAEQWAQSLEKTLNEKTAAMTPAEGTLAGLRQKQAQLEQQVRERDQSLERQAAAADRLAAENKDLIEQMVRADQLLKTLSGGKAGANDATALQRRLAEAQNDAATVKDLTAQADGLRRNLAASEQELAALRSTRAQTTTEQANLRAELTSLRTELAESGRNASQLTATVAELRRARGALQDQLAAGQGDTTNVAALRDSLVQANAKVADLQRELAAARPPVTNSGAGAEELKQQLVEANQALEKSGATVAELTAANEKLEHDLDAARQRATDTGASNEELAKLRQSASQLASLRARNDQLTKDNEQLTAFMNGNRSDLEKAQGRVSELEKQLADALTVRTRNGGDGGSSQGELAEANQSIEKLNATVAELTAANEKLEKDLDNAQKSTAAALAAQSQAVNAASPDAFQMEISTLNSRIKQLEAQAEEERSGAAREIATVVSQLQRTRETNKSLTDANRALLSAKENDSSAVRDDIAQLEGKVRELTVANEELRRTSQKQALDLRSVTAEREALKSDLVDARKVATVLPGLADEKAALQERLETVGTQLVQLQRDHEELQKTNADLSTQLAASRQAADKAQGELAAVQTQSAEAEKAAEAHNTSVAELTQANTRLETEREDMRRLVESYRGDIARLTQAARAAEQQKADAERSGQQNVDAVTAQMAQLRRELDVARTNHGRLAEAYATQERERSATIAQLRAENGAQAARLNQAQGTLDQIAAAARLGTPAATIASGGIAPARPAPAQAGELRIHTVAEGDSLSRISMRYYGTANRWQEIFQANRDVLQGSSALRVGMQLRIP